MPKKRPDRDEIENQVGKSKFSSVDAWLQILPISCKEFQARWSLSKESLDSGLLAASHFEDAPGLVLRAYSLPVDSDRSEFSSVWHDYRIDSTEDSAFFTLPKPAPKINAAIGLINKSGRFSPLVRGDAVMLPPLPDPPFQSEAISLESKVPTGKELAYHSKPVSAVSKHSDNSPSAVDAPERFFSEQEGSLPESTPIEMRAEFVLFGKMAPGMKLLLGNEILEPGPEGFVVWKRKLTSFAQIRALLEAALSTPSVNAGPSLEFFKDTDRSQRLLELHATLEVEGRIGDSDYLSNLPEGLTVDAEGRFKLNRMLPDGAVILPGLSLITNN